ncbi:uncharacterized protein LOC123657756 [Melitaea cinxia]|uniref:uncharacterized protein LOC123657756 n=1 Tax=Melitaea cinxia TaxID=113334 RepID=UPI001E273513|nr:uncharacterized protein LOC123657756 [Melitaea cinxia]
MLVKMLRYMVLLVLFNVYYPSTGLPVRENASLSIASKLQNLANICENSVISEIIKTQIKPCNISDTSDSKTEFKCLMFYDINSQLCSAFRRSKFNLKESFTSKTNEFQDIEKICQHAKTWTFANKEIYPEKEPVDKVFKTDLFCIHMCSVEEILSSDSNFFCKYYQWGLDIIQNQTAFVEHNSGTVLSNLNPFTNNTEDLNTQKTGTGTLTSENVVNLTKTNLSANGSPIKPQITTQDSLSQNSIVNQSAASGARQPDALVPEKTNIANPPKGEIEKPPVEIVPPNKNEELKVDGEPKESVNESPKENPPVASLDEDQEDETDDEPDYNAGDSPDEAVPKLAESDPNLENQEPQRSPNVLLTSGQDRHNVPLLESEPNGAAIPHKNRISIDTSGPSISETFPNSMQDNFAEDDDHFFPLFLTAIIIVVLLYILYHNKNKFTKVILGLLVEGRQTGRRRNSRGHAYRRLDTLEQAMSTNTAAPPSKIIY